MMQCIIMISDRCFYDNMLTSSCDATTATMPPKRPLNDNHSSNQQSPAAPDHHLSPAANHHPDMPADAAVASASPHSKRTRENQSPEHVPLDADAPPSTPNGQLPPAGPESSPSNQSVDADFTPAPAPVVAGQGGARDTFHAQQQQRIISCNLSLIPPSTARGDVHINNHYNHPLYRSSAEDTTFRHRHSALHSATGTTCAHVHVGGRQRRCGRCDCMG